MNSIINNNKTGEKCGTAKNSTSNERTTEPQTKPVRGERASEHDNEETFGVTIKFKCIIYMMAVEMSIIWKQ